MKDIENLRVLLLRTKETKDKDIKKSMSYSVIITLLLSKECFSKNIDIKLFLEHNNIHLKEYVFQNRTSIIGRLLRIIEKMDDKEIETLLKAIHIKAFSEPNYMNKNTKNNSKTENYYDDLLKDFGGIEK